MTRVPALILALGLTASLAAGGQDGADDDSLGLVTRLRSEGRFAEALAACEEVSDPAAAAEARLLVAWEAGDLSGAVHHGLAGLESRPAHLSLLWHTTRLALVLASAELAPKLHARLADAVAAAPELEAAAREAWQDEVARLAVPVGELVESAARRATALARARVAVIGAGILLAAFWAFLARRS